MAGLTPEEHEQLERLVRDIAVIKDKLDAASIPARAVAVRADILPQLETVHGLPRVRAPEGSPIRWGIVV